MFTKKAAIEKIREYVKLCNERNIFFKKIILFGSIAQNTTDENSDIDVLFVSDQFSNNTLENWRALAPVTSKIYDIEPHPYPTENFIKGDPFIDEIKKAGIEIKV